MSEAPWLTRISHVRETMDNRIGRPDVNAYLQAGWKLLDTYKHGDERHGFTMVYCLGWLEEAGEIREPGVVDWRPKDV